MKDQYKTIRESLMYTNDELMKACSIHFMFGMLAGAVSLAVIIGLYFILDI